MEEKKITKSEQMQSIHRMHSPPIETEFGTRAMTEIGLIKGLEIEDTCNYILIPIKKDNEKTTGWMIYKLKKEGEAEIDNFDNI